MIQNFWFCLLMKMLQNPTSMLPETGAFVWCISSLKSSAHSQIFLSDPNPRKHCNKQLIFSPTVSVHTIQFFIAELSYHFFIGVSVDAHGLIFYQSYSAVTKAGKVPLLDKVTLIFYQTGPKLMTDTQHSTLNTPGFLSVECESFHTLRFPIQIHASDAGV